MLIYILKIIAVAFYLSLPAYFANMAPVVFARAGWLKTLDLPVDGGRKMGEKYIFGSGKTWRGIVAAVIVGIIVATAQAFLYEHDFFRQISIVDYPKYFLLFGSLAGLGAILGDLLESFFKRRLGIASGGALPVFDQLDFILGYLVFTFWIIDWSPDIIGMVFLLGLILHPLVNLTAYALKIKKVWW